MEYRDRNVLVTGGTGAAWTAIVAACIEAGAICHVPWLHEGEAQRFGYRDHKQVKLIGSVELTDEAAVRRWQTSWANRFNSVYLVGEARQRLAELLL